MATVNQALTWARKHIGYREGDNNDNDFAAIADHANYQAWCATFVVAMSRSIGLAVPNSAYTPTMYNGFKSKGAAIAWRAGTPQPGDILFVYYHSLGRIGHTGIVEAVEGDYVVTIEGNTNDSGSRQGNGVYRKRRAMWKLKGIDGIIGYGRPEYTQEYKPAAQTATSPGRDFVPGSVKKDARNNHVKRYQVALIQKGYRIPAGPTGYYGEQTVTATKALQAASNMPQTGVPGDWELYLLGLAAKPDTAIPQVPIPAPKKAAAAIKKAARKVVPGVSPVYWNKLRYGAKDSDSVKALQTELNAVVGTKDGSPLLPVTGNYLALTKNKVAWYQRHVLKAVGSGADGLIYPGGKLTTRTLFKNIAKYKVIW